MERSSELEPLVREAPGEGDVELDAMLSQMADNIFKTL